MPVVTLALNVVCSMVCDVAMEAYNSAKQAKDNVEACGDLACACMTMYKILQNTRPEIASIQAGTRLEEQLRQTLTDVHGLFQKIQNVADELNQKQSYFDKVKGLLAADDVAKQIEQLNSDLRRHILLFNTNMVTDIRNQQKQDSIKLREICTAVQQEVQRQASCGQVLYAAQPMPCTVGPSAYPVATQRVRELPAAAATTAAAAAATAAAAVAPSWGAQGFGSFGPGSFGKFPAMPAILPVSYLPITCMHDPAQQMGSAAYPSIYQQLEV